MDELQSKTNQTVFAAVFPHKQNNWHIYIYNYICIYIEIHTHIVVLFTVSVLRRICVSRQKRAQAGRQAVWLAGSPSSFPSDFAGTRNQSGSGFLNGGGKHRRRHYSAVINLLFILTREEQEGGKRKKKEEEKKKNNFSGGLGSCLGSKSESKRGFPVAGARLPIKDESVLSLPAAASRQRSNHSPPPPPPPQRP